MANRPTLHHKATGIHPGAFVQNTAPNTADVQDGVLWVDTSTSPPFALRCWRAALHVWEDIGPAVDIASLGQAPTLTTPLRPGDAFTLTPSGTQLIPQWQPCCAEGATQPVPVVVTPRRNQRCGAAVAMATALEQIYASTRTQADYAYTSHTVDDVASFVQAIAQIFDAGLNTGLITLAKPTIVSMVSNFQAANNISFYPPLSLTQKDIIQKGAYCALGGGTGTFTVTVDTMDAWYSTLRDNASLFFYNQLPLLQQLMTVAPPQAWETIAYVGAQQPSNVCQHYTCKLGTSLTGGALLGGQGHSLRGGAMLTSGGRSMRGGAQLTRGGTSLSGGARL